MKSFWAKQALKALRVRESAQAAAIRAGSIIRRAGRLSTDESGSSVFTDNAGIIILGLLLVMAAVVWVINYTNSSFFPSLQQKFQALWNYTGS